MDIYSLVMIVLLVLVTLLVPVLAVIITRVISPEIDYRFKRERFESGNPSLGRARGFFVMQYYPYLLMFSSLEPLIVLLTFILFSYDPRILVYLVVSSIVLVAPPLYYVYREAGDIRLWREE